MFAMLSVAKLVRFVTIAHAAFAPTTSANVCRELIRSYTSAAMPCSNNRAVIDRFIPAFDHRLIAALVIVKTTVAYTT